MTEQEKIELKQMSDKAIRRAQDLVFAQIPIAFKQHNGRALAKLHEWENDYADEMTRRHLSRQ